MEIGVGGGLLAVLMGLASAWCGAEGRRATDVAGATHPAPDPALLESLSDGGGLRIEAGSIQLHLRAGRCEHLVEGLLACDDGLELAVSTVDRKLQQTLRPASILLKRDALVYRGQLPVDARPEAHSFVISDVDADGKDDLLLWSGREGAYGGPSFDVYLFDEGRSEFRFNEGMSDLTKGYVGLFGVDGQLIVANAQSGCCLRVQETYVLEDDHPKLVERTTVDARPGLEPVTVKERVINGELRVVGNTD